MIGFVILQPKTNRTVTVPSETESQLVAGLCDNAFWAYSMLYKRYAASLLGAIMKIVNQQETAEDLLQEVFIKIKRSIYLYDSEKSRLFTWMLKIARNTAIDHLRLKSSRCERKNLFIEEVASELQNHFHLPNTDTIGMKGLLQALTSRQQLMIELAYYQGYTHPEIAELLDMPLGSVKTTIRQAILALRKTFNC